MVPGAAHRALIVEQCDSGNRDVGRRRAAAGGSALVLEPDLELHLVLDDLAVLDARR